jgi:glycerol-1-phosphate dehydrogenase [NAD(P)+]
MTREALDRAVALADGIRAGSAESAEALMDALVLSGLAMQLAGCTRPASGAEHHIAHYLEMQYMLQKKPPIYHGIKVGVACALVAEVYNRLAESEFPGLVPAPAEPDPALAAVFGPLWPDVVKENTPTPVTEEMRNALRARWDEVRGALRRVPKAEEIRALLRLAGAPALCEEAGIPAELRDQAMAFGHLVRRRMTMMRLSHHIKI